MENYDAVIIGMGISGLTTHALLSKNNMNVIGIERRSKPGGLLSSFERGGIPFVNLAGSFVFGCGENGFITKLLKDLNIENEVEFIEVDIMGKYYFPENTFEEDVDLEIVKGKLIEMFPNEKEAILEYYKIANGLYQEFMSLIFKDMKIIDFLAFPFKFPYLIKYGNKTVSEVLYKLFKDEKLISHILACTATFMPGPILNSSFAIVALLSSFGHKLGMSLIKDGTYNLARAFEKSIEENGGEILTERSVEKIIIKNGVATGVKLEDGNIISSRYVVSCVDTYQTFFKFLKDDSVPKKLKKKIDQMSLGPSVNAVYLALTEPPDEVGINHGGNVYFNSYSPDKWWEEDLKKVLYNKSGTFTLFNLATKDCTFINEGIYPIMIMKSIPNPSNGDLKPLKEKIIRAYQNNLKKILPDVEENIIIEEAFTPKDFEVFDSLPNGAVGWEAIPNQMGRKAIQQKTYLKNLYLAGQWTTPGQGINTCIISSMEAVRQIFKDEGDNEVAKYIEKYRELLL